MADVSLSGVVKDFGEVRILHGIALQIRDGEFMVFVGPSGCGKSTLLRIIAGLEPISSGDLYIGDKRVNGVQAAQRDIAFVFQLFALYPHMNVRANIAFPLKSQGAARAEGVLRPAVCRAHARLSGGHASLCPP